MTEAWKSWEGQIVDGFPLRQYLGGSDHSAVYLTQLTSSGSQNAAIKFIPADASAEAQLARWRVAGQLSHPFLQPLIRVGRCQLNNTDFLYVVMEYAEENLAQILPQRALEPQEVRQVLDSLIQALIYLHGQGLAHTSIKPGNILASGDQLKISSDTLCEIGSAPLAMPRTSIYTAPEARSAPVSTAADVWSIGVTLVEMLTQRTPTIKNQTRAELPVPETIPPPFLAIARHCVQMDAGRRATVKEIEGLLNPASGPAAKRDPNLVAPNVQVTPADPVKKSLSAQQVSYAPHTLMPVKTTTPAATTEAPSRKRNVALPLVAAILVFGAILVAPRVMNRFSPLRPQAASVEPTIAPASSVLDAPPISTSKIEPNKAIVDKSALRGSNRNAESPNGKPAGKNRSGRPQGSVLYQVVPDVSQRARDTILGKVRVNVKLKVDSGGSVTSAEEDNDNASHFFADQAVQVAKRWTFNPPEVDGHPVASEWVLRFEFTPTATKVFPTQTTP